MSLKKLPRWSQGEWMGRQTSQLIRRSAGRKCWEAWGTFGTGTGWMIAWKDRGVEKGSGRRSTLRGPERPAFNQTKTLIYWYCFKGSLWGIAERRAKCTWAFPSATMPSWAETEIGTEKKCWLALGSISRHAPVSTAIQGSGKASYPRPLKQPASLTAVTHGPTISVPAQHGTKELGKVHTSPAPSIMSLRKVGPERVSMLVRLNT